MSILLRGISLASAIPLIRSDISSSCFHSSSILHKQKRNPEAKRSSARTRLVNDLKPGSEGRGKLEVAPRASTGKSQAPKSTSSARTETRASFKRREVQRQKPSPPPAPPIIRDAAPHLSAPDDTSEPHSAPYQRVKSRIDIEDTLVTPSQKSQSESLKALPTTFTSPPLLDGLVSSLHSVLGPSSHPTPIQALSIKHVVSNLQVHVPGRAGQQRRWKQVLLASETGSGKSFAYMLPLLQDLKNTELNPFTDQIQAKSDSKAPLNPRAIVLAPTHELSRQLATFAKSLSHSIKLRILSASRTNTPNISSTRSASRMAQDLDRILGESGEGEVEVTGKVAAEREADVLVSTPMKLLEMLRGRYWREDDPRSVRAPRMPEVGFGRVEWVVVDEADVLYDPDFRDFTQDLLADISRQRGHPISHTIDPKSTLPASAIEYPFHLILTTATIPALLNTYLEKSHPSILRLASPNLHRLPRTLRRESVGESSGNRNADVEKRIKQVWAEDAAHGRELSRIVVFCNRSTKVQDLCQYLEKDGVKCVEITSTGSARLRNSNRHLAGFLKSLPSPAPTSEDAKESDVPRVLVTTSLLSRGLDFSPSVSHVFILDEPRNKVDFLHRAGRTARAGGSGTVVIFGKGRRAADLDRDLKKVRVRN